MAEVRFLIRRRGDEYVVKELRKGPHWWSRSTWEFGGVFPSLAAAEQAVKDRADPREEVRWYNKHGEPELSW